MSGRGSSLCYVSVLFFFPDYVFLGVVTGGGSAFKEDISYSGCFDFPCYIILHYFCLINCHVSSVIKPLIFFVYLQSACVAHKEQKVLAYIFKKSHW